MFARFAWVAFLTLGAPGTILAESEVVRDPSAWDFAPLLYYDRVVCGTVISTSYASVSTADLHMDPPDRRATWGDFKAHAIRVTMQVHEVLRGIATANVDTFLVLYDSGNNPLYPTGGEMVVCLKYHPFLKTYIQGSRYGRYRRAGEDWKSERTARGERTFTDAELRSKIAAVDVDHVAMEAELIIDAIVESADTSDFYGPDSSAAEMLTVTFKIQSIQKGSFPGEMIEMKGLMSGMYLPAWRKHIPRSFVAGQRWMCFLKKNDVGWYPFAGTNGLLRIENEVLIYDDRVPFWHSKQYVDRAIAKARALE